MRSFSKLRALPRRRVVVAAVLLLGMQSVQCFAIDLVGLVLNKNRWGAERPCLDCCVCPDDYCKKPQPFVQKICPNLCPDYCPKPEPFVPKICPGLCDDYCKKPQPYVVEFCCRPGLRCVADCPCCGSKAGECHRFARQEQETSPTLTAKAPATPTKR